ncbi:MAG: FAD-dependent oxidoreductase, partial [Anaerolineae bacterium]|nr:FAD-dependent oxidoreductase [Anaerolineae bacterium]
MSSQSADVIIVGGGVMGCAVAYYLLKADPRLNITIIERDSTYAKASTTLSDGNTRIQFNLKENIQMSLYGLEVLARFSEDMATDEHVPDVAFRQQGNLFIIDEASEAAAKEGLALQKQLGCEVEWLEPDRVRQIYPIYSGVECVGATFGPKDGTMSPLDVLLAYRRKAISLGARVLEASVGELLKAGRRMRGVRLTSGETLTAETLSNMAGACSPKLAQPLGVTLPI